MRDEVKQLLDYCRYVSKEKDLRGMYINMILYYAQYLSIDESLKPLLWSKFFNINGVPYLAPFIAEPFVNYSYHTSYAVDLEYVDIFYHIDKAYAEMMQIKDQMGEDGLKVFISGICDIQGRPSVDPWGMLFYTMKGKDKIDRVKAKDSMKADEQARQYTKTCITSEEDGEETIECTKYV